MVGAGSTPSEAAGTVLVVEGAACNGVGACGVVARLVLGAVRVLGAPYGFSVTLVVGAGAGGVGVALGGAVAVLGAWLMMVVVVAAPGGRNWVCC